MPNYNLQEVKTLAQEMKFEYAGRKVLRDINNLGYERKDVADCISQLSEADFSKTHYYPNQPAQDAYICKFRKKTDIEDEVTEDELYIKFYLSNGQLRINFSSFHLSS